MQTVVAARNPYAKLALRFREELKWRAARMEEVTEMVGDRPLIATVKMDGELAVVHANADAGFAQVYNRTDKARWDFKAANDMRRCVVRAGHARCIAFGELIAVDSEGTPLRLNALNSILKRKQPTREQTDRLALAIFDLYQLDDDVLWDRMSYVDRFALVHTMFAGCDSVRPVAGQALQGEPSALQSMWRRHILDANAEGLVLRANGVLKVKPVHSLDCAVVGYKLGAGRNFGRIGSLMLALRTDSGNFVYAGLVGSGLSDTQRDAWAQRLKPARTGQVVKWSGELHLVTPQYVAEIETETIIKKVQPGLFWDRDLQRWDIGIPKQSGIALKHPRFLRWRSDKDAMNRHDVRLSQAPGWESSDAAQVESFVRRIGVPEDRVDDVVREALKVEGPVDLKIKQAQTVWEGFQRAGAKFNWEDVVIAAPRDNIIDPEHEEPWRAPSDFEDLIGQAIPELERFLMFKMNNVKQQDAEAAAAAAAWKAIRAYRGELGQRPEPGRKMMPWLKKIAVNALLDIWREGGQKKKDWEKRVFGGGSQPQGVMEREIGGRKFMKNPPRRKRRAR